MAWTSSKKESFKPIANQILEKSGENADEFVVVKQIPIPSLGNITQLAKDDAFSLFIPKHQKLAGELLEIFLAVENPDDLLSVALYVRERVNPYLFQYAFSVALLHRSDTQHLELPSMIHTFPEKFFHSKVMHKAREYASVVPNEKRKPIETDMYHTASVEEEEQMLHYFREDIGVNLHHWTWHLVYPTRGPHFVINKDRRGELFYYMHRQILARYNSERFSNNLRRTKPFVDLDAPIDEGYFPKLDRMLNNRSYPPRMPNQRLVNLRRENEGLVIDVDDLKRYRETILAAIDRGYVKDEMMNDVQLTEFGGIDILGNIIESTALSPNEKIYGDIHNFGHTMISLVHDPDGRHMEQFSVMGGTATAMRDPIFYRWHGLMEIIFARLKDKLPRYTEQQLSFPGITIEDVKVQTEGQLPNILRTFWSKSTVNIANGIDFQSGGDLLVRFTHLQHTDYSYQLTIMNETNANKEGTCRIFMSPKYDEDGNEWDMNIQRNFFIELDKFRVILKPGRNVVLQSSVDSSCTIPFEQTYRDIKKLTLAMRNRTKFCGCGWPHNLLIPKGKPKGLIFELFVMVSNYEEDKVIQEVPLGECKDAISYCGLKDKKYPDSRSMGFPFDRVPRHGVKTLKDFMTPNMSVTDVSIIFEDKVYLKEDKTQKEK